MPEAFPRSPGTHIVGPWVTGSIELYRDLRTGTQYIGNWASRDCYFGRFGSDLFPRGRWKSLARVAARFVKDRTCVKKNMGQVSAFSYNCVVILFGCLLSCREEWQGC